MAMLVVNDEEFELELARLSTDNHAKVVAMPKMGRQNTTEVPESLRNLISIESHNGTPAKEISAAFGVSQSSISAYKAGATSTDRLTDGKFDSKLLENNQKIGRIAQGKLAKALKHITDEKLEAAKATDLSQIAANMSRVVEKTTPKVPDNPITNNIVFYSPEQIGPNNYDVIDVASEKAS